MSLAVYQGPSAGLVERSTFEVMPLAIQLAEHLSMTEFVPKDLRGNKPAIMAAILTGHEVGLPPMASLSHIDVIEGRPSINAAAQRALILSHGHEIGFEEMTSTRCVMWGHRKGGQQVTKVTYTMDDAKRARLAGKDVWQKHPSDMLVARATGKLGRAIFADVIVGIPYNREELEDGEGDDNGTAPEGHGGGAATDETGTRKRRAARPAVAQPPEPTVEPVEAEAVSAPPPQPPGPSQESAAVPPPDESMPLNQQIAMVCREVGIERRDLIKALTGRERGADLTREEAVSVLEIARDIQRGTKRMVRDESADGEWLVLEVAEDPDAPSEPDLFGGQP